MIRGGVGIACGAALVLLLANSAEAQVPAGVGEGWLGEFDHAARQLTQLAQAIPPEKYGWRPAPGVRSVSEVYMHIALANYILLGRAGVSTSFDVSKLGKEPDKAITDKAEVVKLLKQSFDAVRASYPKADRRKRVQAFGKDVTAEDVFTRILVHNHEHMGQLIAYARVNGVVPPWSRSGDTGAPDASD